MANIILVSDIENILEKICTPGSVCYAESDLDDLLRQLRQLIHNAKEEKYPLLFSEKYSTNIDDINNLDKIGKRIKFKCLCCERTYFIVVDDKTKEFDGWFIPNK
jgi:hypothetical protein